MADLLERARRLGHERFAAIAEEGEPGRLNRPLVKALADEGLLELVFGGSAQELCQLREGLAKMSHVRLSSPADSRFAAAMTTFAVAGRNSEDVQDALWKDRIRVRAEGDLGVRLSAHWYVSPQDIDRTLAVVRSLR